MENKLSIQEDRNKKIKRYGMKEKGRSEGW